MIKHLCIAGGLTLVTVTFLHGHESAAGRQQEPLKPPVAAFQVSAAPAVSEQRAILDRYCVSCHNEKTNAGGLTLEGTDLARVGEDAEVWERVVRKLRAGVMPPAGRPRPERASYDGFRSWLESRLDRAAASQPNPGRTPSLHRLNRAEYRNAVRDLLALDVDAASLLPADSSSYGFDNIGDILRLSPLLLDRYLTAARQISRLAVGDPAIPPTVHTHVVPSDRTQRDWIEGLPFGTRGGILIRQDFPLDGDYVITIRLGRDYNGRPVGLTESHQLELAVDGERVHMLTVGGGELATIGQRGLDSTQPGLDDGLETSVAVKAGQRVVTVAFLKRPSVQIEDVRKWFLRDTLELGYTRDLPYVRRVTISGPFNPTGAADTRARSRIFDCLPTGGREDDSCARSIVTRLARRAYRRPVTESDLNTLLRSYDEGRRAGGFEKGIQRALAQILVSPSFLFRIEEDPAGVTPATPYRISDIELASRLSFFLWSSIPDDQLLDLAERGKLRESAVLNGQVRRMLADPRSEELVSNFAGQWLYLRNVPHHVPDVWLFPDSDENLRRAFRRETELFFASILHEDRSVLDLLRADYTFLNERLARHYGIPHVYGDHFRRVSLKDNTRGGLLGHGSILTVRSYANRTSPVLRGVWILENILGVKAPQPPPDVPDLPEERTSEGRLLTMRERMVEHRANPVCNSCHFMIDPLGLPLENFDAVGRWRTHESNTPIDVAGALPDGTPVDGPVGLKHALLDSASTGFMRTVTEKLLTYALGRGLEYYDMPAVRGIVRDTAASEYRLSALIQAITESPPFQGRRSLDGSAAGVVGDQ